MRRAEVRIRYTYSINPDDYMLQLIFQYLLGNDARHILKENAYLSLVNKQFYRNVRAYVQSQSTHLHLDLTLFENCSDDNFDYIVFLANTCNMLGAMGATIHKLHVSICYKHKRDLYFMLKNLHLVQLHHLSIELYTCGDFMQGMSNNDIYSNFAQCFYLKTLEIYDDSGGRVDENIFIYKPYLDSIKLTAIGIAQTFPIPLIQLLPKLKRLELSDNAMYDERYQNITFTSFSSQSLVILNIKECLMGKSDITLSCPSLKLFIAYSNDFPNLVNDNGLVKVENTQDVTDEEVRNLIRAEDELTGHNDDDEHSSPSRDIYCIPQSNSNFSWASVSPKCHFILHHFDEEEES